jgi:DNA-binding Xre family transcriptional regulator
MRISKSKLAVAMARVGLNLTTLSAKSGISRATISYINNGKSCRPEVAGRIARALGVDVTELIEEVP